jgi:hypothetical protein
MVGSLVCDNVYCPTPRETRKRRAASAPPIIDPVNSFSLDDVSCVQENEENEDESLKWSRGVNDNSFAFARQRRDAVMTTPQHDSDDELSDDDGWIITEMKASPTIFILLGLATCDTTLFDIAISTDSPNRDGRH